MRGKSPGWRTHFGDCEKSFSGLYSGTKPLVRDVIPVQTEVRQEVFQPIQMARTQVREETILIHQLIAKLFPFSEPVCAAAVCRQKWLSDDFAVVQYLAE